MAMLTFADEEGWGTSPGKGKNFPCVVSRPILGPPSLLYTRVKAAGLWSWPLNSNWCRGQENVDLHICSRPTHLYDSAILAKHMDNFTFLM
jgi:hypothetical protein